MRVLSLAWEYPPVLEGGLGRHVAGLSRALVAGGEEVTVLTRARPVPGPGGQREEDDRGVRVRRVALPDFPYAMDGFLPWVGDLNRALLARAQPELTGAEPQVVHSHDWLVADAARGCARAADVPWVVTVHATEHGRHGGRVAAEPQATVHRAELAMVRDADEIVVCSRAMAEHVADALDAPAERLRVIPNGIELPRPSTPSPRREDEILLAGRLVHEKGFDLALQALAPLLRTRPRLRVTVAGAGPARAELEAQLAASGATRAVDLRGRVEPEELTRLLARATVCVVPSRFEPFGIVALEAMAAGCPCVASDTGGLSEIAAGAPGAVCLVAPGDPAALGRAIGELLDDPARRERMSAAGRAGARRAGWPAVATATRAVYAQATHRRGIRPEGQS